MVSTAGDMVLDEGHERPVAAVAHHSRPLMIRGKLLMKSFAGFRLKVTIRWPDEVFMGVDATIFWPVPTIVGTTTG